MSATLGSKSEIETPARQVTTVIIQLVETIGGETEILVDGQIEELLNLQNKPLPKPICHPMMPGQMAYVVSQGLEVIAGKILEREQAAISSKKVLQA